MPENSLMMLESGKSQFHAIEVMACPGGCIGGGGQPLHHGNSDIIKARATAIYNEDKKKPSENHMRILSS